MKKFMALVLAVVIIAMASSFVGVIFANMVLAKNNEHSTQLVVVEATATPSAVVVTPKTTATSTVEPTAIPTAEPTSTPTVEPTIEPTATVEPDHSQISWDDFFAKARYSDNSFNAVNVGEEVGRINFTDEDLMAHVGEELAINVASRSVSVKFENVEHTKYESASVKSPDLSACKKHLALARRHSRAYGDNITIKLTADDITNITTYAAYWYDKTGKLTYGFVVCGCANGAGSGSGSGSSGSSDNGGYHPSDEPTPAPTQEPLETPHPAPDNTPEAPSETADNQPSHNETAETPHPAPDNTPEAPSETASNQTSHNEPVETPHPVPDSTPEAPSKDMVANISSRAEESEYSSTQEVPDPVVEAATDASNTIAHSGMPTE